MLQVLLNKSSDARQKRLKSRRLFVPATRNLLNSLVGLDIRASQWTNYRWNTKYSESTSRRRIFIPTINTMPVGMSLPGTARVKLNRLRTGVKRFHSSMHKWDSAPSPNCECSASEQTADHVLITCPIHRAPYEARGLTVLDAETRCLTLSLPASDPGSTAVWGSKKDKPSAPVLFVSDLEWIPFQTTTPMVN